MLFRMSGKIKITKLVDSQLEGTFYWPISAQCTENDQQSILDLFIVWQFIQEHPQVKTESLEVSHTIENNTDAIIKKWLKMTNACTDAKVLHYSILLFKVIIDRIWKSGLNVEVIREYYPVILKGARDIEEISGLGFMKLLYSKIVVIPTSILIDGILRKRPIQYYAITVHIIPRKTASINSIKDFLEIKDQVEEKERVTFLFFSVFYYKNIKSKKLKFMGGEKRLSRVR